MTNETCRFAGKFHMTMTKLGYRRAMRAGLTLVAGTRRRQRQYSRKLQSTNFSAIGHHRSRRVLRRIWHLRGFARIESGCCGLDWDQHPHDDSIAFVDGQGKFTENEVLRAEHEAQ